MTEIKSQVDYDRYINFINSRPTRLKKSKQLYTENHHIIPRSLGGSNDKSNLILLTGREHFLAHLMLWKAFGVCASAAFIMMNTTSPDHSDNRYFKLNSRQFEKLRIDFAKSVSEKRKGKPPWNKGRKRTDEEKAKVAESLVRNGNTSGPNKGSKQDSAKRKVTQKKNGYKPWNADIKLTEEQKENARQTRLKNGTSNGKKGPWSEETRAKHKATHEKNGTTKRKSGIFRYIHNDSIGKAIPKNDPLPTGWYEGRFKKNS